MFLPSTVFLHSISYAIAAPRPLASLLAEGVSQQVVDTLGQRDISGYSMFEGEAQDNIRRCIAETLTKSSVPLTGVDVVVFFGEHSSAFFNPPVVEAGKPPARDGLYKVIESAGLYRASIVKISEGSCANLLHATAICNALIREGMARNILLVAGECYPDALSRIGRDGTSLAGDGVAAFMMSSELQAGQADAFELEFVNLRPYDRHDSRGDTTALVLESFKALKNAAADCYEACGLQPSRFRWVVVGDYSRQSSLIHSKLLGFSPQATWLKNVGLHGHVPFDPLISLGDIANAGEIDSGQRALLYIGGPVSCGLLVLTRAA